jgi:pantoate--beta-alanine ligase
MYPPGDAVMIYELGYIQTLLEGKFRPGHFQGVSRFVDKLIEFVQPDTLYLGQKDYQQCMVIKKMIQLRNYATQLQVCDTVREKDGLAMSSRNMRLNAEERLQALQIIHTLKKIKDEIVPGHLNAIKEQAMEMLSQHGFKVDYVEIADASHLEPIHFWDGKQPAIALIAAFINEVRLIDNLFIN